MNRCHETTMQRGARIANEESRENVVIKELDYYKRLSEAAVEYLYLMSTPDEISLRKLDKARLKYESIIKERVK